MSHTHVQHTTRVKADGCWSCPYTYLAPNIFACTKGYIHIIKILPLCNVSFTKSEIHKLGTHVVCTFTYHYIRVNAECSCGVCDVHAGASCITRIYLPHLLRRQPPICPSPTTLVATSRCLLPGKHGPVRVAAHTRAPPGGLACACLGECATLVGCRLGKGVLARQP